VLLKIFIIALLTGMSPGPDFFLTMKNSLGYGRKIGIASALGIAAALAIHTSYTILGIALIIQHYHCIFLLIQLSGAIYLAYLGVHTITSTFSRVKLELGKTQDTLDYKSFWAGFRNGFFCNILNPKAFVFFLSIFSQFMSPGTPLWVEWLYGFEVVFVIGAWFVVLSILISSNIFRGLYQRAHIWLERFFGAVLVYFAFRICKSALSK
jgi:RhtB (resistance to homoserine/threonine) family protein